MFVGPLFRGFYTSAGEKYFSFRHIRQTWTTVNFFNPQGVHFSHMTFNPITPWGSPPPETSKLYDKDFKAKGFHSPEGAASTTKGPIFLPEARGPPDTTPAIHMSLIKAPES